jgi:transcription elongation factor/antiterminator RfaH
MTCWYVVHTKPREEEKAVWHLENQGFRCFMPRIRTIKKHARRISPRLAPLFPDYVFVRFKLEFAQWRAINGTRGVVRLLTNGNVPLPVPSGVVEAIITKCDQQSVVSLTAIGVFAKGLKVRVRGGTFAGQTAKINEVLAEGQDRVRVLLTLLGAEAELQLPSYAIESA